MNTYSQLLSLNTVAEHGKTHKGYHCAVAFINPFTARVDDGVCEVVLTFTSVDKILWCDHSNEISLEALSCGVICCKKFYKMKFGIFVEFAFDHIWQ